MKTAEDLEDYFMESNKGKGNSLSFIDFITEIQKEAYNQGVIDSADNVKTDCKYKSDEWV